MLAKHLITFLFLFESFDVFCILPLDLTSLLLLTQNNSSRGGTCRIRERLYSIHTHQRGKRKVKRYMLTRQRPTQSCRCNISSGPLDGFDTENFWATTRWCCSANKRISSCLLSCHFKGVFFFYDRLKFAKSSFPCQRLRVTVFMETGVKILQLLFCVRARCSRATATKFRVNICRNRRTRHCVYV